MKILLLTTHYPCPPDYGAAKRVYHICRILESFGNVTLGILRLSETSEEDRLVETRKVFKSVKVLCTDRPPMGGGRGKFNRYFGLKQIASRGCSLSDTKKLQLLELINESDLVWIHTLVAADMGGVYDYKNSLIDLDDLNSDKLAMRAKQESGYDRWRYYWQSLLWRRWENDSARRFKAVAVCSEIDRKKIGSGINIFTIPNGSEIPKCLPAVKKKRDKVIGFVGILSYLPNAMAVRWFMQEIFPLILEKEADVKFRIVGKLPCEGLGIEHPNVEILGFIQELDNEIKTWDAMIVPLRVGGGTRLKILEAFSKQIPVVSTRLGAYGITVDHGKHLLLADKPKDFAQQCVRLIKDSEVAEKLAHNAYELFCENYTWERIGIRVKDAVGYLQSCR